MLFRSARCSGKNFGQFADELFAAGLLTEDNYQSIAVKLGLNSSDFKACRQEAGTARAIQANVQAAVELGLTQTPTVYVNRRWYVGGLTEQELLGLP